MEHAHWWGPHWCWFWIVPFAFMVLFCFVFPLMRRVWGGRGESGKGDGWSWFDCCGPRRDSGASWRSETPRQILDRRYAGGEITKEQYEQMKRDIETSS